MESPNCVQGVVTCADGDGNTEQTIYYKGCGAPGDKCVAEKESVPSCEGTLKAPDDTCCDGDYCNSGSGIRDQGSGIKISNNRTVHFAYSLGLPHLKVLSSQRAVNDELPCVTGGIVIRRVFSLCSGYFLGGGTARDFRERRSSKSLRVRRQKITALPSESRQLRKRRRNFERQCH